MKCITISFNCKFQQTLYFISLFSVTIKKKKKSSLTSFMFLLVLFLAYYQVSPCLKSKQKAHAAAKIYG